MKYCSLVSGGNTSSSTLALLGQKACDFKKLIWLNLLSKLSKRASEFVLLNGLAYPTFGHGSNPKADSDMLAEPYLKTVAG